MKEVLQFIKQPDLKQTVGGQKQIKNFLKAVSFTYTGIFITILFALVEAVPAHFFSYKSSILHILDQYSISGAWKNRLLPPFWMIVVVYPIMEEFLFRSVLTLRRNALMIFSTTLLYDVFSHLGYFTFSTNLLIVLLVAMIWVSTSNYWLSNDKIAIWQKRYFRPILYSSVFLFTIGHSSNYNLAALDSYQLLILPFLLLPQFTFAIAASFLRIRSGLFWSIALHVLYNGIIFVTYSS